MDVCCVEFGCQKIKRAKRQPVVLVVDKHRIAHFVDSDLVAVLTREGKFRTISSFFRSVRCSGAFVLLEAGCISQITVCKKRLSGPEAGIWYAECELPVGRVRIDRS